MSDAATISAADVALWADLGLWKLSDPDGYMRYEAHARIREHYAALDALADEETKPKLAILLDAALAEFPAPAAASSVVLLTVADLGIPETRTKISRPKWSTSQVVEPERDGARWVTWEDAEHLLVKAAFGEVDDAERYALVRDDAAMTLTLTLG